MPQTRAKTRDRVLTTMYRAMLVCVAAMCAAGALAEAPATPDSKVPEGAAAFPSSSKFRPSNSRMNQKLQMLRAKLAAAQAQAAVATATAARLGAANRTARAVRRFRGCGPLRAPSA